MIATPYVTFRISFFFVSRKTFEIELKSRVCYKIDTIRINIFYRKFAHFCFIIDVHHFPQ
jgi:hypothetical protein